MIKNKNSEIFQFLLVRRNKVNKVNKGKQIFLKFKLKKVNQNREMTDIRDFSIFKHKPFSFFFK